MNIFLWFSSGIPMIFAFSYGFAYAFSIFPWIFQRVFLRQAWVFLQRRAWGEARARQGIAPGRCNGCLGEKGDFHLCEFTLGYLVGGLEHFLFSHILGIIIPIDFHIFQRGSNHQPNILTIYWPYIDHILTIHWPYINHRLTIYEPYIHHISQMWSTHHQLLTIYWPYIHHIFTINHH